MKQGERSELVGSGKTLTVEDVNKMYTAAKSYVDNNFRNYWDQYFQIYKLKRVNRHYEGLSDPVNTEFHTIIETLVANIAGGEISFHFQRINEEQTEDTEVLNSMLDYWMDCNNMGMRNQQWIREMLLYGTAILHVSWVNDKPLIENIALRDFFTNPEALHMDFGRPGYATYAGFVYLGNVEVMKQQKVYSAEQDAWVNKYDIPDDVGFATSGQGDSLKVTDKQYKDQFQGSTIGKEAFNQQIFVVLLYDLISGKLVEMANNKYIIRQVDIPYQRDEQTRKVDVMVPGPPGPDGEDSLVMLKSEQKLDKIDPFIPIAVLRDYVDTSQFYGSGESEVIADRQEYLSDLESMDTDNLAIVGTPMFSVDPQFSDIIPEIEVIPGAVYPLPKGAIAPLPVGEIAANLDEKKDRVAQEMRRATGADETIQGVAQDQGRVTATEVSSTIAQAQNRFSTKIQNLQNEGYAQLGTILYKFAQIFVTEPMAVRIVGPMGVHFKEYDPWQYNGEWQPHAELDIYAKQKALEVGQKLNQIYQTISNSPVYDPIAVQRWIVQHVDTSMSDEEFNKLLAKGPNGPTPEEQKLQAQSENATIMAMAQIYTDDTTTPFIKAQIEVKLGLHPDPLHEAIQDHKTTEMGAQQADMLNPHTTADGKPDPSVPAVLPPSSPATLPAQSPVTPQPVAA